jgi:hypothetical protein
MNYLNALIAVGNEPFEYCIESYHHHKKLGVEKVIWCSRYDRSDIKKLGDAIVLGEKSREKSHQEQVRLLGCWFNIIKSLEVCRWLALIDNDEYIICNKLLPDLLKDYEDADALGINWLCFGSSGYEKKVYPQLNHYTWRTHTHSPINTHIKSIINPDKLKQVPNDPHYLGMYTVNEQHTRITGPWSQYSGSKIRMNHYYTRSREDWIEKNQYGSAEYPMQRFDDFQRECTVNQLNSEKICEYCYGIGDIFYDGLGSKNCVGPCPECVKESSGRIRTY